MRLCSIEDCGKPHVSRGWCDLHYRRWQRHGDPLVVVRGPHVTQHGTVNEYQNYDCRCAACCQANASYQHARVTTACLGGCGRRVWTGSRPYASGYCPSCAGLLRRTAEHGTESKYNQGCRCQLCKRAGTAARRARRHANIEATRAYDRAYKKRKKAA